MLSSDGTSWDWTLFRRSPAYGRSHWVQRWFTAFSRHSGLNAARDASLRLAPACRRRESDYLDAHERYVRESLAYKRATAYVDGTKNFRRTVLFANSGRFDMKFLFLVRDGRGFARSYRRVYQLGEEGLAIAAQNWARGIERMDVVSRRFGGLPVMWVRYEDLCRDFDATMTRLFDFIGVPHEPDILSLSPQQHVHGNNMRFRFDGRIKESLAWRTELSDSEIAMLNERMKAGLERFDYL
jgi:hypothetical protein